MTPHPAAITLTLDATLERCTAALVHGGAILHQSTLAIPRASTAALPALAAKLLRLATPTSIAVTIGPGSFTGIRAALALAHGIALGADIPLVGVTCPDAIRAATQSGRPLWIALDSRRARVFLDTGTTLAATPLDHLPAPTTPIAIAGDAAIPVAARLAARGFDVQLLTPRTPCPLGIAAAALLHPRAPLPLYVDPPEARPNAAPRSPPQPP